MDGARTSTLPDKGVEILFLNLMNRYQGFTVRAGWLVLVVEGHAQSRAEGLLLFLSLAARRPIGGPADLVMPWRALSSYSFILLQI